MANEMIVPPPSAIVSAPTKTITFTGAANLGQYGTTYSPGITLNGAINDVVTAVTVSSGTNVITGQVILVESEQMLVTAGGGSANLTVTRAYGGTSAASHADTTAVTKALTTYDTVPIWTVSGTVLIVANFMACTTDLTGATATFSLDAGGVNFWSGTLTSTTIDTGESYVDGLELTSASATLAARPICTNTNIRFVTSTTDTTGGVVVMDCWYIPVTAGANIA